MGVVMEKLGPRRSEMLEMRNPGMGMVRLTFKIPARGLFGYRSEFMTDTRGTGIMHHRFLEYGPWAGPLAGRKRGVWSPTGRRRWWRSRWATCRSGPRCSWRRASRCTRG